MTRLRGLDTVSDHIMAASTNALRDYSGWTVSIHSGRGIEYKALYQQ